METMKKAGVCTNGAGKTPVDCSRVLREPLWLGEQDLAGKTLLVYYEQGLGDTLQFCRFIKLVADRGASVIFEVQPVLAGLMEKLEGVSQVVPEGASLPRFDYHCPLLSLPLALKITLDTLPAPRRYLESDASRVSEWQSRLGPRGRRRVGLAWSGNPRNGRDFIRSVRLADWIEHLPREFDYICLQREINPADRQVLEANPWIRTFELEADCSGTAALCECVDITISVCTSIAHLSAGLGKTTWVMLAVGADFRWLHARTDSPWYPTVKLYRQTAIGDWPGVFRRVGADLASVGVK